MFLVSHQLLARLSTFHLALVYIYAAMKAHGSVFMNVILLLIDFVLLSDTVMWYVIEMVKVILFQDYKMIT